VAPPERPPDETRALSRLAFDELRRAAGGVEELHLAIAGRAFGAAGPGAVPARAVHDAVATRVYGMVRGLTGLVGVAADAGLRQLPPSDGRRLSSSRGGAVALGALGGLIGDELERQRSALQQPMAVRVGGRVVPRERETLQRAFPQATPRLAVFLHGLMGTELAWGVGAESEGDTYGRRLAVDLAVTPLYVRYNSGRHVSENGRSLADLLEELLAAWPTEVEQIALVGHSMGGLVARSACHYGSRRGDGWVRYVRHVVSLGSPHMGAPLAQGVHWATAGLDLVPETRPFAAFLRRRSAGIRDMRQGSLVDDDWRDRDPDALRAAACREIPLLEGATHCFVAATVTRLAGHPLGRLLGDCLVLEPSASGRSRTRRIPFHTEHGMHLGAAHHLALLNHPAVYERLREWLATPPPAA
jgi:triacylglycerol esterase/lipase EstA (alpha/beta hydrolase family)